SPRAVARELSRIERELGAQLFERLPGRLIPTRAATGLAEHARQLLARESVARRGGVRHAALRVGWIDHGRGQQIQRTALAEFRAQYPHVPVQLVPAPWRDQMEALANGSLGVAFFVGTPPELAGFTARPLLTYTVDAAAIPLGHRLAAAPQFSVAELSGFPLHSIATDFAPEVMTSIHDGLAEAGWRGVRTSGSPQPSVLLSLVACGAGWSPVAYEIAGRVPQGVAVVPIADDPILRVDYHAVWREEAPAASAFVRLVFELRDALEISCPARAAAGEPRRDGYVPAAARRYAEQVRAARDLHDTLLQNVVGSGLQLDALRQRLPPVLEAERRELDGVVERLERIARNAREAIMTLVPDGGDTRTLPLALSIAADSARGDSRVDFRIVTLGAVRELQPLVDGVAYQVGAEAIASAFQRASGTFVSVTLDYTGGGFRLDVSDDSAAPVGVPAHPGMEERAATVGALLTVRSGAGGGTSVELSLPGDRAFAAERP
ncbi:MAG TPA: LysR substrate-binding domain-containing protein, partial [Longimicrobium sp.]